jgi:hypothetical protein
LSVKKSSRNFKPLQKVSIYFPESRLINGLQAKEGKKIADEAFAALLVDAGLFVVAFSSSFLVPAFSSCHDSGFL